MTMEALIPCCDICQRVEVEPLTIGGHACLVHFSIGVHAPEPDYGFTVADARTGFRIASGHDRRAAIRAAARRIIELGPTTLAQAVTRSLRQLRRRGRDHARVAELGPVAAADMAGRVDAAT